MPRRSDAVESLPAVVETALAQLGNDLAIARKRRQQSLRDWAVRLNVSIPTLVKMEKGDPTVSVGVYATALWLIKRQDALRALADPQYDLVALESDIKAAARRGAKSNA